MELTLKEITWAQQAVAGDREALGQLLKSRGDYLYRTAYLYVGNQADALDVIQEATTQAVKTVAQLRDPNHFFTWFTRILIRQAQALYRRRQKEIAMATPPEQVAPPGDATAHLDLLAALQVLGADYRQALQLFYYQDMSISEISQLLEVPEGTVKTRLRRGRSALQEQLGGNYYG
ncbi:sigma-70 family RNA polymerase sigma factor [Lapidilactobacillus salsurivasis]